MNYLFKGKTRFMEIYFYMKCSTIIYYYSDGSTCILRHNMTYLDWELILFEEEKL